jgi:hypothetical protein
MSYPGNAPGYPPVSQHPAPYAPQSQYPPQQQYQQYPPPQQYPPQPQYQPYPPPNQYPPQGYPPAPAPYGYPPAPAWAPAPVAAAPLASYGYGAPAPYAAYTPAVAVTPAYAAVMPAIPMGLGIPQNYVFQFQGVHLDRKDIFSKSDPFLAIFASKHPGGYRGGYNIARQEARSTKYNKKFGGVSGNWVLVHRTETLKNNQNPVWAPFTVNLLSICGGNFDTVFKIEVWDSDVHTNHDFIGGNVTTMRELTTSKEVRLINKRRIGIYNTSGRLEVLRCSPA